MTVRQPRTVQIRDTAPAPEILAVYTISDLLLQMLNTNAVSKTPDIDFNATVARIKGMEAKVPETMRQALAKLKAVLSDDMPPEQVQSQKKKAQNILQSFESHVKASTGDKTKSQKARERAKRNKEQKSKGEYQQKAPTQSPAIDSKKTYMRKVYNGLPAVIPGDTLIEWANKLGLKPDESHIGEIVQKAQQTEVTSNVLKSLTTGYIPATKKKKKKKTSSTGTVQEQLEEKENKSTSNTGGNRRFDQYVDIDLASNDTKNNG